MIEKNQLQKILKSILRRKNDRPDHQIMHPFREWLLCLCITTLLLAIMVFFCVRLYQHYSNLAPGLSDPTEMRPISIIYRSEEVALGLETFTTRVTTHEQIEKTLTETSTAALDIPAPIGAATSLASSSTPPTSLTPSTQNAVDIISSEASPAEDPTLPPPVTEAI